MAMMTSRLLPKTMSVTMVLPQPESVLMSVSHVPNKDHIGSELPPVVMLLSEGYATARPIQTRMTCAATQGHGIIQTGTISGSALPQPGST